MSCLVLGKRWDENHVGKGTCDTDDGSTNTTRLFETSPTGVSQACRHDTEDKANDAIWEECLHVEED